MSPRIQGPVEESTLTTFRGNVPLLARAEFDQGPAPAATQLTHVRLLLSRSVEQEAALEQYMAEQQDKTSPNYHKWLTPEEFGTRYGPADSDIAAIVAWLESRGLKVETVSSGRTTIAFSGTVGQMEASFHTSIHAFNSNGETFTSNVTDPQIPTALAAVVSGVAHLNTIRPKAHHAGGEMGKFDPDLHRMVPASTAAVGAPKAQLTTGSAGNYSLYLVPGDAATIYNSPNNFNLNFGSGVAYTGQGMTIGIGGDAPILTSTVLAFRNLFLGDAKAPVTTYVGSVTNTADIDEAYIDVELAGGLAPGATIHYYASADLYSGLVQMLTDNSVDVFSLSFGACELGNTTAGNATISSWWQQAAAQGIAVTVSTGDSGSATCDDPNSVTIASNGLAVSGFASTPYNIAVGGTDFDGLLTGFTTYADTTSSPSTFFRSAKSYIPESTWNDSPKADGLIKDNVPYTDSKGASNIVAGGGGVSSCSTNTSNGTAVGTCTTGYAKPSWQRGPGVPADGARDLPDISLMSGNGFDSSAWLVCTDKTGTVGGVSITANCSTQSDGRFYFGGFGGTSTASPAFAGILAMVAEKQGGRLGMAAQGLYDLFNGPHAIQIFHDVTVGNNSVICGAGTANCVQNAAGWPFETGYDTTAGYDLATGLGSVDATGLVTFWGSTVGSGADSVSVVPSATSVNTVDSFSVKVTVTGSGTLGTPTGTVIMSSGKYNSTQVLSGGSAVFSLTGNQLAQGTDVLSVRYSGDTNYSAQTGSASVTVHGLPTTVTVSAAKTTIYSGNSLDLIVMVGGGPSSGTITISGGGYVSPAWQLAGIFLATIPPNSLAVGALTLTASYSGDAFYAPSAGTTSVTVTPSSYTIAATPPVAVSKGGTSTSTVTISTTTGYTGNVTLNCTLATSPAGAVNLPSCLATAAGSLVSLGSNATTGTGTLDLVTTAATAQLERPHFKGWMGAGGGFVLAFVVMVGIPARRRKWQSMLGVLVAMVALGFVSGCGGGGGGGGGTVNTIQNSPGTTAGTYTFTVTGTGNPALATAPATTITLVVN